MPQKGIEFPVNSVIVIALAIFVLLMIASFFGKSSGELDKTQVNTAFNQACSQLSSAYNCDEAKVSEVETSLVINGQAKSLLDVCRMKFNNPAMSVFKCMRACAVCTKIVSEDSPCEDDTDCQSSLTSGWKCSETGTGKLCRGDAINTGVGVMEYD